MINKHKYYTNVFSYWLYTLSVQVQPGLGLSEVWYSWIVSVASVGLLIGSITLGFLVRWFYAKYLFVGNLLVCIAGGVLYAAARNGWMLLASESQATVSTS